MKKILKYSPLLIIVVLLLLMFSAIENFLIFYPSRYPEGNWTPTGLNYEDAWFKADDGTKLHGWFVRAPDEKGFAVYSHGNAGNISGLADYLKVLSERTGLSVLAYDYRGYGKSEGEPDAKNILLDGKAATLWLAAKTATKAEQIIQMGRSLGGAVAIQTSVALGSRGLILESTFTSLAAMGKRIYPWLPISLLIKRELPSLATLKKYSGPLLVFHGDKDELVPEVMGKELFAGANEPKRFVTLKGGGHNDFPPPYYFLEITSFVDQL